MLGNKAQCLTKLNASRESVKDSVLTHFKNLFQMPNVVANSQTFYLPNVYGANDLDVVLTISWQIKVVPVTKISLQTDSIPHLTNVMSGKGRVQSTGIAVVMENVPHGLRTRLHGTFILSHIRQIYLLNCQFN
jgi:hypothetical protein